MVALNRKSIESTVLVSAGLFLLAAAVFKIIDPFFSEKIFGSFLFAASLILDLVVGAILVTHKSVLLRSLLGAILFATYSVFVGIFVQDSCDCFGQLSGRIDGYWHLLLNILILISCIAVFASSILAPRVDLTRNSSNLANASMLSCSLIVFSVLGKSVNAAPILKGVVIPRDGTELSYGSNRKIAPGVDGEIRISNESREPIQIVGCRNTSCFGRLQLNESLIVRPGEAVKLKGLFQPTKSSLFQSGTLPLIIGTKSGARNFSLNWIVAS